MPSRHLLELAEQVAYLLGPHWISRPDDRWPDSVWLADDAEHDIVLILTGAHITARGFMPKWRDLPHGPRSQAISMAAVDARYVSGHLQRRLLPKYDTALTQWRELAGVANHNEGARDQVAAEILRMLACSEVMETHPVTRATRIVRWSRNAAAGADLTVHNGGASVDMRLTDLTPAEAAAVSAVISRRS
jgi:hypothetical protein